MTSLDQLQIRDMPPDDEICHCTGQTIVLLRYEISESLKKFIHFFGVCFAFLIHANTIVAEEPGDGFGFIGHIGFRRNFGSLLASGFFANGF